MNIAEMSKVEVEARKAEISALIESAESVDAGLMDELKELNERAAELADMEQRKADAEALNKNEIRADKVIEVEKTEEREIMFEVNSIEYRNAWMKNIVGRQMDEAEQRALTSAGAVIPTMTVNEVIGKLKETPILGKVSISEFPSYVRFPVVSASASAAAAAIGTAIQEGTNTIGYVDLTPNEYTKVITLQSDIENMAIDALYVWLVNNITNEVRAKIAADILVGSGAGCCKGITASVNADATNLHSTLTKADLLNVMAALPSVHQAGATFVMSPNLFYNEVMALTTINDYVINDGFGMKLFGHDVVLMSEACVSTKETIFYGDLSQYKLNIFKSLEIKPFETATSLSVSYRGGSLVDGELADTTAVVRFAKA